MDIQSWIYSIPLKLRSLFRRSEVEQDLDDELRYHVEMEIERGIQSGLDPQSARYAALRSLGSSQLRKEECRDTRGVEWLHDFLQDVRYSLRTLAKSRGFTLVSLIVLGLGIGANTAVFTVVHRVLLRPLPFPAPERLYLASKVPRGLIFEPGPIMVDEEYLQFRKHTQSFEAMSFLSGHNHKMTLTGSGEPVVLNAAGVGADLMRVLGVSPMLGRNFEPEASHDDEPAVLLSSALWQTRFGAAHSALGQSVILDGKRYTIVGVMPPDFDLQRADLWVQEKLRPNGHNVYLVSVVGRLRPGVSAKQAQAELAAFVSHSSQTHTFHSNGSITRVLPFRDLYVGDIRKLLLIFAGAVALVFLIACANFANLLLIRGSGRQPEMAVRAALGASRWRLLRQLITESVLLSLGGAALGILLSYFCVRLLIALVPSENLPPGGEIHTNMGVLLFASCLAMLAGIVPGLIPALQTTRRELREGVNEGGRNLATRSESVRGALVVLEIALALILLAGAGLLVKSFLQIRAVKPGFQSQNLAATTIYLPDTRYHSTQQMQSFDERVLQGLTRIPGVQGVAAVSFLPFGSGVWGDVHFEGIPSTAEAFKVDKPEVSAGYFRTMGIPILRGREFTEHDDAAAPGVAIISDSVARKLWPTADAVGKRLSMADHPKAGDWLTIVGVAGDVRQQGFSDKAGAVIYQPYKQIKLSGFIDRMSFVIKSDRLAMASAAMRDVIRNVDRDLPVETISSMDSIIADSWTAAKSQARLLAIFALLALSLAAVGIYGVLACSVVERLHEIGIRMALGAAREDIVTMILQKTLLLTSSGLLLGTLGAFGVTRVLEKLLFEVKATDPATFLVVAAILAAVALLSAWAPARRAAGVQPLEALRHN
jgi:putative ABC transport system permease protein